MTKRAAVIIAVLFLIPVIAGIVIFVKWKKANPVVGSYDGSVDMIEFGGDIYIKLEDSEELAFELGQYLGKIGDRLIGAPVYRVKNDETGDYLAVVGDGGTFLFTESGKPADGEPGDPGLITRLSFNRFEFSVDDEERLEEFRGILLGEPDTVFVPSEWDSSEKKSGGDITSGKLPGCRVFRVDACYGGSAVAFGRLGWIVGTGKNRWFFIPFDSAAECEEKLKNEEIDEREYAAVRIDEIGGIRLMTSVFTPGTAAAETGSSEPAETTG